MKIDSKIISHIKNILSKFANKYINENGDLKRSKLIEDLDNFDKDLMTELFNDKLIYRDYVEKINNIDVFRLNNFVEMFEYKEFWEDSYTKYSNKIGLTSDNKFIDESSDIVLDFPFKDTVLKAGMTKYDSKINNSINESFLNYNIARSEIDELFEPKIFKNSFKYNTKINKEFNLYKKDNLIIKGNNLIALHSLKKKYEGKIKLIYLDPPYNTGNDSFEYNDNFNESSWLTFMKNRLEIARDMLRSDGHIIIQTDDKEQAYLKVLMDNIFGRNNYLNTVSILFKNIAGASGGGEDKRLKKNLEYLTIYTKDHNLASHFNSVYEYTKVSELVKKMRKNGSSWKYTSVLLDPGISEYIGSTKDSSGDEIKIFKQKNYKISSISQLMKTENITEEEAYDKYGKLTFTTAMPQSSIRPKVIEKYNELSNEQNDLVSIKYIPKSGKHKDKIYQQFYKGKKFRLIAWLKDVSKEMNGNLYKTDKLGTFWNFVHATNNVNKEGKVKFENGKKPEALIAKIIEMATNEKDLVMDFFLGSGSTAATSMKMKRQFIGIEQIENQIDIIKSRLKNVINGDQSGISKDVNWHGGGSFVYAELMEKNKWYLNDILQSKSLKELDSIDERMKNIDDLDFRLDLDKYEETKSELNLEERKQIMVKMLDKNQLYYNYNNIDDENVRDLISDSDYKFNKSFYDEGE